MTQGLASTGGDVVTDLHVQWRSVAVASLLLNMGTLAAVAIVATVNSADALATVALALAVIAFVCQLIIFSVQTWQSGQQLDEAKSLNAQTESLLAEARTRIEGTHQMVSTQYQELLHLTALKGAAEVAKEKVTTKLEELSPERLESILSTAMATQTDTQGAGSRPRARATHVQAYGSGLTASDLDGLASAVSWPTTIDEATPLLGILKELSNSSLYAFCVDLGDDLHSRMNDVSPGLPFNRIDEPLIQLGLVEEVTPLDTQEGTKRRIAVTEKGRQVGSLLAAPWPPPEPLKPLFEELWSLRGRRKDAGQLIDSTVRQILSMVNDS